MSAVTLSSIFDLQDIKDHGQITGSVPWQEPNSTMHYITFNLDIPEARGGQGCYFIGFNVDRSYDQILSDVQATFKGYLHGVMNSFRAYLIENDLDYITKPMDASMNITDDEHTRGIQKILLKLRQDVFTLLQQNI